MNKCLLFLGDLGGSEVMLLLIFPVIFIVHFIPSIIGRKRPDFFVILLVNILAGWSIIGWFAALYLAIREKPVYNSPPSSVADELAKLRDLRDQGVLTPEEFEHQKNILIR